MHHWFTPRQHAEEEHPEPEKPKVEDIGVSRSFCFLCTCMRGLALALVLA
jgi:hypothetical protein